jgi:hypothetical protein
VRAPGVFALAALLISCSAPPAPPLVVPTIPVTPASEVPRAVSVLVIGPNGLVPSIRVCADRPGREERCATSGADGRAALELATGTYAIRATPGDDMRLEEGVVTVDIGSSTNVTVSMRGLSRISGTVRDPEARGVRGAEVCAHAATSADLECVRTGSDGTYVIETPPGIHKLSLTGPADGSRLMSQWARGRLDSGEADAIDTRAEDATGVDVALARGIVLSGTVTAARGGAPVEGAQVCTYTLAAPVGWYCEATDRRGRYNALREPGRYWVWTIPPDVHGSRLIPQRFDRVLVGVAATPVNLSGDRRLDVALTEGVVVSGRVTTTDGAPVVLGLVCMDTPFPTGRICRSTGDDGTYEFPTRPETYVLSVVPPGDSDIVAGFWRGPAPDWTKAERIPVRGDLRLDVTLPRGVRLAGTVLDARGVPVESATVNLNDASGPRFFGSTDIHGRYSIAVLPGVYTVDIFPPRGAELVGIVGRSLDIETDAGYDVVLPDISISP